MIKTRWVALLLGTVFGFALSLGGATTFDNHWQLFALQNFTLLYLMGIAVAVAATGIWLLRRWNPTCPLTGQSIHFATKPMKPGLIWAGFLFGAGWAMSGACPGTAPAMLAEGKLSALWVLLGILLGTYLYSRKPL